MAPRNDQAQPEPGPSATHARTDPRQRDWSTAGLLLGLSAGAAVLAALSALVESPPALLRAATSASGSSPAPEHAPCPPATLEDRGVCIPVPETERAPTESSRIEKHPGRPADFHAYSLPLTSANGIDFQIDPTSGGIGFVLTESHGVVVPPIEDQLSPATLLSVARTKPGYVTLLVQVAAAETENSAQMAAQAAAPTRTHSYVIRLDHLRAIPPELQVGQSLEPGTALGTTAVAEETGQTRLQLEIRRLRSTDPGASAKSREPREASDARLRTLIDRGDALLDPKFSTEIDPRNVLTLHEPAEAPAHSPSGASSSSP